MRNLRRRTAGSSLALLATAVAILAMAGMPITHAQAQDSRRSGDRHPGQLSDSVRVMDRRPGASDLPDDFELGLEASVQIARYYGIVETDSLLDRVNDIGYRVALVANRPDILFTFQVLDMDEPNAMALPGGWIFVTKGILDLQLTDAELAHLLGHEISHVTHSHFSRQGRLDGLLSLLQTALLVTVTLAGSRDQGPATGPVIEDPDQYYPAQTSRDAAAAGTAIFGSVFHELLLRGYGRKLEMEADDGGRRLAALAGYPREAGEGLLRKLHDRIYEDREFGYWRTHPYFTDRVAVAAAARGVDHGPGDEEVAAYRVRLHNDLAVAAAGFRSGAVSEYLYELALRAGPATGTSLAVHLDLLQFRRERMERRPPLTRAYGPMIAACDSLLLEAASEGNARELQTGIRETRDSLARDRDALLPEFEKAIGLASLSPGVARAFLANFPGHPRAPEVRLRLARLYQLSSRNDLAVTQLGLLLAEGPASSDAGGAERDSVTRAELLRTIPLLEDPGTCEILLTRIDDAGIASLVRDRLNLIADSLKVLETVGRFVQTYPESAAIDRFRSRLETLADAEFKKGRLHESLGDQQSALDLYNRVSILAQGTKAAADARLGITRIQSLVEMNE